MNVLEDSSKHAPSWDDPDGLGMMTRQRILAGGVLTGTLQKQIFKLQNFRFTGGSRLAATLYRRWGKLPYGSAALGMPLFSARFLSPAKDVLQTAVSTSGHQTRYENKPRMILPTERSVSPLYKKDAGNQLDSFYLCRGSHPGEKPRRSATVIQKDRISEKAAGQIHSNLPDRLNLNPKRHQKVTVDTGKDHPVKTPLGPYIEGVFPNNSATGSHAARSDSAASQAMVIKKAPVFKKSVPVQKVPVGGGLIRQDQPEIPNRQTIRHRGNTHIAGHISTHDTPDRPLTGVPLTGSPISDDLSRVSTARPKAAHRSPNALIPEPLVVQRSRNIAASFGKEEKGQEPSPPSHAIGFQDRLVPRPDSNRSNSTVHQEMNFKEPKVLKRSGSSLVQKVPMGNRQIRQIQTEILNRHTHLDAPISTPNISRQSFPDVPLTRRRRSDDLSLASIGRPEEAHRLANDLISKPSSVQRFEKTTPVDAKKVNMETLSAPYPEVIFQDHSASRTKHSRSDSNKSDSTAARELNIKEHPALKGPGSAAVHRVAAGGRPAPKIQREILNSPPIRHTQYAHTAARTSIPCNRHQSLTNLIFDHRHISGYLDNGPRVRPNATHRSANGSTPKPIVVQYLENAAPVAGKSGKELPEQAPAAPHPAVFFQKRSPSRPDFNRSYSAISQEMNIRKNFGNERSGLTAVQRMPFNGRMIRHVQRTVRNRQTHRTKGYTAISAPKYVAGSVNKSLSAALLKNVPPQNHLLIQAEPRPFTRDISINPEQTRAQNQIQLFARARYLRNDQQDIPSFPMLTRQLEGQQVNHSTVQFQRPEHRVETTDNTSNQRTLNDMTFRTPHATRIQRSKVSENPSRHFPIQTATQPSVTLPAEDASAGQEATPQISGNDAHRSQESLDVDQIVEKVWKKFNRKLTLEQERRGYRR